MEYNYKPIRFFALTLGLTWTSWFLAAFFSYQSENQALMVPLMLVGLIIPAAVALFIIYISKSKNLKQDFWYRLINVRLINIRDIPVFVFLMPLSVVISIAISVLFGVSPEQFTLSQQINIFNGQALLSLIIPILAPTLEEIGWRGYGVDSLKSKFSLLKTSIIFSILWGLWHVPLFFINNYYQNGLWKLGVVYVLNFFISIFPLAIILNWLYYKNNRSILVAILFHISTVISAEMFLMHESTKLIQTVVLVLVAIGVVIYDKKLFLKGKVNGFSR